MPFTIQNLPEDLERAIREAAEQRGVPVDEVAVDALRRGLGPAHRKRDLSKFVGIWEADPALDAALARQRQVEADG